MTILVLLLCIFNLVMWLLAIVRFRKLFSTDDILERTRHELNNMMMEINRNAERNVTLIEDRTNRLKETEEQTQEKILKLLSDADHHIEVLMGDLRNVENSKIFQSRLSGANPKSTESKKTASIESKEVESIVQKSSIMEDMAVVPKRKAGTRKSSTKSSISLEESDGFVKKTSPRPRKPLDAYRYEQKSLFDEDQLNQGKDEFTQEIDQIVRNSSFEIEDDKSVENERTTRIAQGGPEIIISKNPIKPKESKKAQVLRLFSTGLTADEISQQLKMSTSEVDFILAME